METWKEEILITTAQMLLFRNYLEDAKLLNSAATTVNASISTCVVTETGIVPMEVTSNYAARGVARHGAFSATMENVLREISDATRKYVQMQTVLKLKCANFKENVTIMKASAKILNVFHLITFATDTTIVVTTQTRETATFRQQTCGNHVSHKRKLEPIQRTLLKKDERMFAALEQNVLEVTDEPSASATVQYRRRPTNLNC
ncbi:hypothetical protein B566_EDAN013417 [Ephemera danica]|nr:hypothetical protein B566_EDAN013417 [Ephemera danica]